MREVDWGPAAVPFVCLEGAEEEEGDDAEPFVSASLPSKEADRAENERRFSFLDSPSELDEELELNQELSLILAILVVCVE